MKIDAAKKYQKPEKQKNRNFSIHNHRYNFAKKKKKTVVSFSE